MKRKFKIIKQYTFGWAIALTFLVVIRTVGTTELGSFNPDIYTSLVIAMTMGAMFGAISGYFQFLAEEKIYKRASLRQLLIFKAVYLLVFLLAVINVGYLITYLLHQDISYLTFVFDKGSGVIYFYIVCVDLFMLVLRQVNLMLGEGNLTKLLTGQFYNPREEERIFMFLDLQSSTQLAEALGHIKYSQLIQECFNDLGIVAEYDAEIYQYVGDEAILTWPAKKGLKKLNCIKAYYAFKKVLESKQDIYKKKYSTTPFFKAGLNMGTVTSTEVGKYKREIAYHGDTLNTAARIQAKCNEYRAELLIGESLIDHLEGSSYLTKQIGNLQLRGKQTEVGIYTVSEVN